MNEELLRLFLDVVQLGSFQKVAEKNYVSQRAVSRQIQRLEQNLHTQLFERKKNKIVLTPAGEFFKKRSEAIINMLDATEHELHRFSYRVQLTCQSAIFRLLMASLSINCLLSYLPL